MPKTSELLRDHEPRPVEEPGGSLMPKTELQAESESWVTRARALQITDAPSYLTATNVLRSIKGMRADIQRWFAPHVEGAMDAKRQAEANRKALVDEQARMEAPLLEAESRIKRGMLDWDLEQERQRYAEQQRRQAEADRDAERLALEAAAALEREGHAIGDAEMVQEAHDLLDQPTEAEAIAVPSAVPKVEGITYRENWVPHPDINVKVLAAAVGAGTVPVTFLSPNMPAINAFARATKGTQAVPGIRWMNDRKVVARG